MKTILAPIDFSAISDAVVNEAGALARALSARVVLLTVIQPPVVMSEYAVLMDVAAITAAGEKHAAQQLDTIVQKLKSESVSAESVQVVGAPVAHIVAQASTCEADYIVMGSHGHTSFYDLLVGSTTHGVLMRAKCPVVIVPAVKDGTRGKSRKVPHAAAV